jgi:hypothetical protein
VVAIWVAEAQHLGTCGSAHVFGTACAKSLERYHRFFHASGSGFSSDEVKTMSDALYINGVFDEVLRPIAAVHTHVPEQILFLQPYSDSQVSILAKNPPSTSHPVRLYLSVTEDLTHVHYFGEIVGWEDKRTIASARRAIFDRLKGVSTGRDKLVRQGRERAHR